MIEMKPVLCVVALAALVGCSTPSAVYELADKSSANAAVFGEQLGVLGSQSRALAERRASHIASMDAFNAELLAEYQRDLALTKRTGDWEAVKKILDDLAALRDELERIQRAGVISEAARRQEIMNSYVALEPNVKAVREVARALSALAEKESRADRVKFFVGFARQVRDETRIALAKEDDLSKAAGKLLNEISGKLKPGQQSEAAEKKSVQGSDAAEKK